LRLMVDALPERGAPVFLPGRSRRRSYRRCRVPSWLSGCSRMCCQASSPNEGPVAFLHLDADLYSSTKTVLDLIGPRLVTGSVVLFDEYFSNPGWQDGEHRAWLEYVDTTGLTFDYAACTYDHEHVIVVVTDNPGSGAANRGRLRRHGVGSRRPTSRGVRYRVATTTNSL